MGNLTVLTTLTLSDNQLTAVPQRRGNLARLIDLTLGCNVITGDIPLASRCLGKGAAVLGLKGKPFTEDNIGSAVATRDLLTELRASGTKTKGPAPFEKGDRSRFLQELDKMIHSIHRAHPPDP